MCDGPTAQAKPKYKFTTSRGVFIGLLIATALTGVLVAKSNPLAAWVLTMALIASLVIAAGYNIKSL
ncbi:MAG: hypothetical protein VCA73_00945 [Roseibacillus sp.]|jgi:uncharacterized protein YacL